jgi:archaellum biogenesis ATPase FlaH
LLALRPKTAALRERSLPERRPITEAYGIGGPISTMTTAVALTPAAPRTAPLPRQPLVVPPPQPSPRKAPEAETESAPPVPTTAVSVFSANRPVVARDDLFGRQRDLDRLLAWVLDQSGNALIYGPRGYGKTSLVRVFGEIADGRGHVVIYASCSRNVDFDSLMRSYLAEIPEAVPPESLGAVPLGVQQVAMLLAGVTQTSLVLIIDEFDRIERDDTRQNIIELIKDVSDLTASVRFVLVGVATDATAVLGYHPSVQRCITCVPLTRLAPDAIADMFARKAKADRLVVSDGDIATVVRLTAGSAYHAQLIGQKLVSEARRTGRSIVQTSDLNRVIDDVVADAALMDDGFAKLARAMRHHHACDVMTQLAHMALAGSSDLISFAPDAPPSELRRICVGLTGDKILQHVDPGDGGAGFRFTNAFLPQLLLMIEHRVAVAAAA